MYKYFHLQASFGFCRVKKMSENPLCVCFQNYIYISIPVHRTPDASWLPFSFNSNFKHSFYTAVCCSCGVNSLYEHRERVCSESYLLTQPWRRRRKKYLAAPGNRTRVSIAPFFSVRRANNLAVPPTRTQSRCRATKTEVNMD